MLVLSCAVEAGKHISARWTRSNYLWAPANTFFLQYSYKTIILSKKVKFQVCLFGK